ncbi:MAG: holin family protein [Silicimonas sp.]|nr:holin family protein [Silicimonas sp.]
MGLIGSLFGTLFGGGQNVIRDTVEVFRPNAEAQAVRDAAREAAALAQFAAEFTQPKRGWFDRMVDGLNRLPRPLLAFGTLGLFASAMVDPVWFAQRMQGVALVPEPLWWLMGAIVSFYFGARHQAKSQEFQKGLSATLARTIQVTEHIRALEDLKTVTGEVLEDGEDLPAAPGRVETKGNAALKDWRRQ